MLGLVLVRRRDQLGNLDRAARLLDRFARRFGDAGDQELELEQQCLQPAEPFRQLRERRAVTQRARTLPSLESAGSVA